MKFGKLKLLLIFSMFFVLAGCLHKTDLPLLTRAAKDQKPVLIAGASFFSGDPESEVRENINILVEKGRIGKISADPIDAPGAIVIDAAGKMVIPGLIDSHIHIFGSGAPPSLPALPNPERNITAFLYAGITTVADMGGPVEELEALNQKLKNNEIAGPRLFYAGKLFTLKDGHPAAMIRHFVLWPFDNAIVSDLLFELEGDDDIKSMILENKNHGAGFSKLVADRIPLTAPTLDSGQIKAIVDASKKEGFMTVAHIGSEENIQACLDGGVRIFIHGPYRSKLSENTIRRMKAAGSIVTPTVAVFDNIVRYARGDLKFSNLDREILDPVILAEYKKPIDKNADDDMAKWVRETARYQEIKFDIVKKLKAAGIPILAGSDSINPACSPGGTLHRELELLVTKCGFTPVEAVAAATFISGKLYTGVTGQSRLGYLKEGLPADILILNGDFREDITQTRNIFQVISKGRVVKRHTPN